MCQGCRLYYYFVTCESFVMKYRHFRQVELGVSLCFPKVKKSEELNIGRKKHRGYKAFESKGLHTLTYNTKQNGITGKLPLDPPAVNYQCCPQYLVFHQAASTPLGLKLIFVCLVSSTFLHICSKSYYEALVT